MIWSISRSMPKAQQEIRVTLSFIFSFIVLYYPINCIQILFQWLKKVEFTLSLKLLLFSIIVINSIEDFSISKLNILFVPIICTHIPHIESSVTSILMVSEPTFLKPVHVAWIDLYLNIKFCHIYILICILILLINFFKSHSYGTFISLIFFVIDNLYPK